MRNILFKAKTEEGKWLEGYLHKIDGKGKGYRAFAIQVQDIDTAMCRPHSHEVIPETIGQFTGLTDKNGKKIFEGDIVRFNNQIGKIINEYGSFGIGIDECINYKRLEVYIEDKTNNYYSGVYNDNFISLWEICWNCNTIDKKIKEVEVIGNIYDNKELLGE